MSKKAADIVKSAAWVHKFKVHQNLNKMNTLSNAEIKKFFPMHTMPCVKSFILLMNCIVQTRTVCLYKCRDKASEMDGKRRSMNNAYTKLIRFFKMKDIGEFISGIRSLMLAMTEIDLEYLIVDRTNWKRGTKNFNLLTIGGLIENVFIPLHWIQLNKQGGSNVDERKKLMEGLCNHLSKTGRAITESILLADREFIGSQWFEYLKSKNLSFVIRLREKMYFELQTITGKKNFVKVVSQRHRALRNFCNTNDIGQCHLYFCND